MPRAIIVVPCYNEARRLDVAAVEEYGRRSDAAVLLFVNDGSLDETLERLEQLHQRHPRQFSFLHLARNGGKAEAVRQGMLLAMSWGAEYVGFWDADLATPLSDIPGFVEVLDRRPDVQAVIGSRLPLLGRKIERQPLRAVLGRLFARVASLALGVRFADTQCGAKIFRATPALQQVFADRFSARWIFDVEIFARLKRMNDGGPELAGSIYEYPLDTWRDVAGSSVKGRDFMKAIAEMARIWWRYLRPGAAPYSPALEAQLSQASGHRVEEPRRAA